VGRESLWWGPGFHGSTLVSNNALALDMVRVRTAKQVTLPWVFVDLFGPLKFALFFGQLEEERTSYPRSKVTSEKSSRIPGNRPICVICGSCVSGSSRNLW